MNQPKDLLSVGTFASLIGRLPSQSERTEKQIDHDIGTRRAGASLGIYHGPVPIPNEKLSGRSNRTPITWNIVQHHLL